MSASIPLPIGGDRWNARIYAGLSAASELAAEFDLPEDNSEPGVGVEEVRQFLNRLNEFLARGLSLTDDPNAVPAGTSKEKIIAQRDAFLSLYRICERILLLSKKLSFLGQMKTELETLHELSERLLDVADWFDALSTPEETDATFEAAGIEWANGDFVPWSEVQ